MKKVLLIIFICGLTTTAFSQFLKKGSIIGGGSFDFRTTKYKDYDSKSYSFSLIPWAGYLVIDNLVVGANLEWQNSGSKSTTSDDKSNGNSILVGSFVRYYLKQGVFFHGENNFGFTKATWTLQGVESTSKWNSSHARFGVGYAARISESVLFEPMMGYYNNWNDDVISNTGGFFIMGGFTIILKTVQ
jgi:hypothetical protein